MSDPFGEALIAYLEGGTKVHEIERDDGNINVVDTGYYFSPFDKWHPIEQKIAGYAKGRVLEIGCGAGRVSKYLESQGHEVIGIDISRLALQAAKKFGATDCRLMDANNLDFPEKYFETASLLGNGLGIVGDMEKSRNLLINLSRIVRPDGVLIATSRDAGKTENPAHLAYHEMNRKRGMPIGQVKIRVNFEEKKGKWFDLTFFEVKELDDLIHGTGWIIEKLLESDEPFESGYGVVLRNAI